MDVSNRHFLAELYRDAPDGSRGHVTGFINDPDSIQPGSKLANKLWKGVSFPLPLNGACPMKVSNPGFNNYCAMGVYRGARRRKEDVAGICAIFIDDVGTKGDKIDPASLPLKPSWLLETAPDNYQAGYLLEDPVNVDLDAVSHINAAIAEMHGDKGVKDLSRYLRLPVGMNRKLKYGEPFRQVMHAFDPELRYTPEQIAYAFNIEPAVRNRISGQTHDGFKGKAEGTTTRGYIEDILTGDNFHDGLIRLAGRYVAKNLDRDEVIEILRGLMERSDHPHDDRWKTRYESIEECVDSAFEKGWAPKNDEVTPVAYPKLREEALHGLAGDVVRAMDPYTESDPVAILAQFLVAYGNVIGRCSYYLAEDDRHYTNEDIVLVGETAKGRKGTSWGRVNSLFAQEMISAIWAGSCIAKGLSSGEGLIWRIRDEIKGLDKDGNEETKVDGVADKRLLVIESEFASTLKVASREGNTLSAVIRDAWDGRPLSSLTKNSPTRCAEPHVSVIGHITRDELLRYLDDTSYANGFGNRFLWLCSKRSKVLPDGGRVPADVLVELRRRLTQAITFADGLKEIGRTEAAREIWHAVYPGLSEGESGLVGALKGRAEAHVVRLATLYALLDEREQIDAEHMTAALALWEYASASVDYTFGDALGDPQADTTYRALLAAPDGLTRTQVSALFNRHAKASRIESAVQVLVDRGLVEIVEERTGGRPVQRIVLSAKQAKEAN